MSATPIKLGIVGLSASGSWASRSHLPHLIGTSYYKIVALQNSSEASASKAAEKYELSDVACYGDIESLIADPNVDMVLVSVKVPDHAALIEPVLNARKNVFVEWPLARNFQEAAKLTSLAKAKDVKTMVGLQARQNPSIRKAKDMVEAGELGDILGATMTGTGMIFGPSMVGEGFAYGFPIENGANLITIPAGHAMDAFCYVLGEFKNLQATLANNRPEIPILDADGKVIKTLGKTAHDYIAVTGHLQRGGVASVIYQGGVSSTGKDFYWEINGTKGSLVLQGDGGHIQMFHPSISFVKAEKGAKLEHLQVEQASSMSYNVGSAWDAFSGQGDGHLTTFEDALLRHRMIDAIYRSDKNGTRESYL